MPPGPRLYDLRPVGGLALRDALLGKGAEIHGLLFAQVTRAGDGGRDGVCLMSTT